MKVFLSAASTEFKACREALRSDLAAVGCEVRVQEDFQTGPRSLIERLEEYVAACDRVVALVGAAYGSEAKGQVVPVRVPARSYTQWEYFLAMGERLDGRSVVAKDLFVYLASDAFKRAHPVQQPDELADRQRQFIRDIRASGKHWAPFDTVDQLRAQVLRDGWPMVTPTVGSDTPASKDDLADYLLRQASREWSLGDLLPAGEPNKETTLHVRLKRPLERAVRAYLNETFGRADLQIATGRRAEDSRTFERWEDREEQVKDLMRRVLARVPDSPW